LDELGVQELGERWDRELAALNGPADVVLRANTLKTNREALAAKLAAEGIETEPIEGLPHALRLVERRPVTRLKLYQDGLFEVQDGGSQMIAPLLRAEPNQRVIDACAGAGGKSLHLAALMRNKGELLSLDVEEAKLEELKRRAVRAGAKIISTELIRQRVLSAMEGWADRLLLDVPCSGLGTLRRQPDLKWRLTPEFLEQIRGTQREILRTYPAMLKPGGLFVYSTCSILPSENEEQVRWLLETMGGHTLLEEYRVWPSESGFDGFYMALLKKAE
jgi:16S rRNA (cytosine967-C5)-methyltransferase